MNPKNELNEIFSHLQELQADAESLRDSINSLSYHNESFKKEKIENEYIDNHMRQPVHELSSILIDKFKHTESFIENALDAERMEQLVNFYKADSMNYPEN